MNDTRPFEEPFAPGNLVDKRRYMPGLDGLRALAVLAVIFYHLNLPWAMGGFYGVTLFFVLSGYLITDILLTERKNCGRIALGSFWLRRAKRLLPAVFMLLICVTIYVAIFRRDLLPDLAGDLLPASFYYSNWWFIFRNVSYFQAFNLQLLNHFWSLGVEEQFYIFWPLLLILILPLFKKGRILVVIALTLASALAMALLFQPGQDPNRVYYGTDTRAFSLLCGAVVAFIVPSTKIFNFQLAKLAISGAVALAGCMCIMVFSNEYSTFTYRGGMLLFSALCAVLILCAAHPDTWAGKFFSLPPLRSVGKISYGLYLWQYPIILLTEPAVNAGGIDPLRCVLQVALAIMLSTASYIFIEDPIRRSKSLRNANWKFFKRRMPTVTALPIVLICTILGVTALFTYSCRPHRASLSTPAVAQMQNAGTAAFATAPVMLAVPSVIPTPSAASIFPVTSFAAPPPAPHATPSAPAPSKAPAPAETSAPATEKSPVTPADSTPSTDAPPVSPAEASVPVTEAPSTAPADSRPATEASLTSASAEAETNPASAAPAFDQKITFIGDSIAIDVAPDLESHYANIGVDGKVSRQFAAASQIVSGYVAANKLGDIVVIELGSNGPFSASNMRSLIELAGPDRAIYFVNTNVPRSWCPVINNTIASVAAEYPNVQVIDWYGASAGHSEYFGKDAVHPNAAGSAAMAALVEQAIEG